MSNKLISDWEETLEREIERLGSIFTTQAQFDQAIQEILGHPECPLAALQYIVECPDPFSGFMLGLEADLASDAIGTINLTDNRHTTYRVIQWWKAGALQRDQELGRCLQRLFESHWKPTLRTESAGMADLKRDENARVLAHNTVVAHVESGSPCSMLFCDLDNFKPINDASHEEGDRIIKEFGAILESTARNQAVALHNGGDEFVLLLPRGDAEDALLLAYRIQQAVTAHNFRASPMNPGISIGIASLEGGAKTFVELIAQADRALVENAKPMKGVARFPAEYKIDNGSESMEHRLNLAHCLIKSEILSSSPFASVWLNCLSRIVTENIVRVGLQSADISKPINNFIQWARLNSLPILESRSAYAREIGLDALPAVSTVDYCFAIAHAILRAAIGPSKMHERDASMVVKFNEDTQSSVICLSNGRTVWATDASTDLPTEYDIGICWELAAECQPFPKRTARAMLIQIGHDDAQVPLSFFAERIVVDDRPTRGGGLPDFWEATIARLVAQIVRNPNIAVVYLLGQHQYGALTVAKLRDVDSWLHDDEQIGYKTGTPLKTIGRAAELLKGKVQFPADEVELVTRLSDVLRARHTIQPMSETSISLKGLRFLEREMRMAGISLGREDGCRVKTIAEAYPVVLEIVRKASEELTIRDQAGQELRELVDFKVHLTNPDQDLVPAFYQKQEESLDKYFQKEFLSESGLFGRRLKDTGQLEAVLAHVVSAITNASRQFATRRAILVVPHEIVPGKDLAPLGLISVRCILRFAQSRAQLHYSYTWRTVEALVGFPYSLYGSVRFAQHLTEQIKDRLPNEFAKRVEMGEVSYIAHSLHMFMDDYGQNIARTIVNDASF
jgi:diguanylate cyclase (GGDEF)-like protein